MRCWIIQIIKAGQEDVEVNIAVTQKDEAIAKRKKEKISF